MESKQDMAASNFFRTFPLLAACLTMVLAANPASSMLLSGHLEEKGKKDTPQQAANQPSLNPPNTFPKTYQGTWYVETTVTDSTLPAVTQGQVIGSEVVFFPSNDGLIHARWNQPGWVETQSLAVAFNGVEAKADRTTYYFGDSMHGSWAARSRDQFIQVGPDQIQAKSYVDQYLDGQYLGRYRTESVLKRTSGSQMTANNYN